MTSPRSVRARAVALDVLTGADPLLSLEVKYTPEYPDAVPHMRVLVLEDEEEQLGPAPADQSAAEDPEAFVSDARPGVQELTQGMDQVVRIPRRAHHTHPAGVRVARHADGLYACVAPA